MFINFDVTDDLNPVILTTFLFILMRLQIILTYERPILYDNISFFVLFISWIYASNCLSKI